MKLKLTYTVYLFPFFLGLLSASTIELQQMETQQHVNNQINQVVTDSDSFSDSNNDDKFAEEFYKKEIRITINYYNFFNVQKVSNKTFSPDPNRAEIFLDKAKYPSQVPFATFLDDYIEQLDEYISLARSHEGLSFLFNFKKYEFLPLCFLAEKSARLSFMNDSFYCQDNLPENIEQDIKEAEEKAWGGLALFDFNNFKYLLFAFVRVSFILYSDIRSFSHIKKHLQHDPPQISNEKLYTFLLPLVSTSLLAIGTIYARSIKYRNGMWLSFFCTVDYTFTFFNIMLSYRIRHFLCNPIGLIIPFWRYFSMTYTLRSDSQYKKMMNFLEKGKKVATNINDEESRIELLHTTILQQGYQCLKPVAQAVNSFIDKRLWIEATYPQEVEDMQSTFYKSEVVIQPIASPMPCFTWFNFCKVMTIASFVIGMLMGGFYFGVSLFSIARAIDRA